MECPFCLPAIARQIVRENEFCYAIWTEEVPVGSAMVLPKAHRGTVFDLTAQEWAATQHLLAELRVMIGRAHRPDGWNVGWNVEPVGGQSIPHAHCHLVPRYREEPLAGRGIRAWLKDPDNRPPQHAPLRTPSWRITVDAPAAEPCAPDVRSR
ncbi:HIT family protein [Plantactinospora siamensis]|uniref:HIT family protein n=1 Tax=Plantactinospora siamensis TaxID=555372 RepID=A0ABV6P0S6_9ACTN